MSNQAQPVAGKQLRPEKIQDKMMRPAADKAEKKTENKGGGTGGGTGGR